jgi:predicted nucleic acid-binding protein
VRAVADSGPLIAAANRGDEAHRLAASLVAAFGRELLVLDTVIVEVDHLLRTRAGAHAARSFLRSLVDGQHAVEYLGPHLLHRAADFDLQYADLGLGIVDGSVMAYAERHRLPILTFDFEHFRATRPETGYWQLIVDEARYQESTR